jgi:methylenetetrahydrofolate reductase (NADPH)
MGVALAQLLALVRREIDNEESAAGRKHARRLAQTCGASNPKWLDDLFEGLDDLPAARQLIAATVAAELCGQLYAGGVRHFHFYTLNRAELSYAICHLLGVRAQREIAS